MQFIVNLTDTFSNTTTGGTTPENLARGLQNHLNKDFRLAWGVSAAVATITPVPERNPA